MKNLVIPNKGEKTLKESAAEWLFEKIAIEKEKQEKEDSSVIIKKLFESVSHVQIEMEPCELNFIS